MCVCWSCAQFGNGTLRLTTRQTYQLHGVLKQDLKTVFSSVIKNMGTTLGACGDVNRNVLAPPAPFKVRAQGCCTVPNPPAMCRVTASQVPPAKCSRRRRCSRCARGAAPCRCTRQPPQPPLAKAVSLP